MLSSFLLDESRFHILSRGDTLWIYDERDMGLYSLPADDEAALVELARDLDDVEEPFPVSYHTRTRISNLKLALSNRCPSDCAYCFRPTGPMQRPRDGLIRDLIEEMVHGFGRDAKSYTVTFNLMSEPLADLDQLAELKNARDKYVADSGKPIEIYVCTSATIQTPEALEALADVSRGRLVISVDGPEEAHDRFRRDAAGLGTYERAGALAAWGIERGMRLEAQAVLTRAYPYPDRVARHLFDLGFDTVAMKPVRAGFEFAFREEDLPALFESYNRYFIGLELSLASGDPALFASLKSDFALRPMWKLLFGIRAESRCLWGSTHVVADSLGDYYPCDSVVGRGDFRCGSLGEGLDWERFHADASWRARQPCPGCWARGLCGGTCYINNLARGEPYLAIDPIECAMSRYFAKQCIGLMIAMTEAGQDPYALREILLGRRLEA